MKQIRTKEVKIERLEKMIVKEEAINWMSDHEEGNKRIPKRHVWR